jgi:uncharacterized protein YqjF (DUF2071 family)
MSTGQNDFPYSILDERAHRPYPMPDGAWMMTQTWHDLLFAHWPVDANDLRAKVPAGLELDVFDGQAWVGVIPFHMTNVAPRGVPALPWVSAFPELNVCTYVRMHDHPGVYFFSLDAGSRLAVGAARTMFSLPYYSAEMRVAQEHDGRIAYSSRRTSSGAAPAEFVARYGPVGDVKNAARGTLEYFLTERYCLYTVDSSSRAYRVEIHHPAWPLQAAEAQITTNTMADAAGIRLPSMAPLLHFARRQDVVNWGPKGEA